MDVQLRAKLGIGYYYERDDGKILYIPIDRGRDCIEPWLKRMGVNWVKVELNENWDADKS